MSMTIATAEDLMLLGESSDDYDKLKKLLVSRGADVNLVLEERPPLLHYAVFNEDVEIVKFLIDNGAKLDAKEQGGWTATRHAASQGNRELVTFLPVRAACSRFCILGYNCPGI